ncbi:MAG: peroxiredoxin [Anaerolineae bacterium]|nr:peroxiredoxin [Anaerolineae bacterium]
MPGVGAQAPDFELPNQDGKPIKLSDFRGKKVILFAFPQAFTAGCTTQACGFRDQFPQVEAHNAVVLGISPDQPATLKSWKQEKGLQYDLLSDSDHKVLDAWAAWGISLFGLLTLPRTTRSVWVIGEDGRIIDAQVGISPKESVRRALAAIETV